MAHQPAESALIAAAVAGDRVALNDLLLRHFDRLQQYVSRRVPVPLSGVISADDVLQETFVRAIRGISGFQARDGSSFGGWLETIADRAVQHAVAEMTAKKRGAGFRRQQVGAANSSLVDLVELLVEGDGTPSAAAARHEALQAVQVGIAGLPDDQRQAVRLRYLQGHTIEQTGDELGRSPAAVRGLLHRAKTRLRDALGRSSRWFSRK